MRQTAAELGDQGNIDDTDMMRLTTPCRAGLEVVCASHCSSRIYTEHWCPIAACRLSRGRSRSDRALRLRLGRPAPQASRPRLPDKPFAPAAFLVESLSSRS